MNELISNAFKHAFNDLENANLAISISSNSDQLIVSVRDNGVSFDPMNVDKRNSLGMNLIDSLSDQLSADVDYESNGDLSLIHISEPTRH